MAAGTRVTVVTSAPNFPAGIVQDGYRNRLFQREIMDGVEVARVWTYLAPNQKVVRRSLDFLSFAVSGFFAGLAQPADVIMATSPQLLAGMSGALLAFVRRKPWLLEIRDLWPDSIVALDMMADKNVFVRLLRWIESRLYRSAHRIVTTNEGLRERLIARGVPANKIGVVPNGVDGAQFTPRPRPQALLDKYGLAGKFVVGYIGTQGLAHDLQSVVKAAEKLRGTNVAFLFVGDGAQHQALVRHVERARLDDFHFVRSVPAEEVPDHIACCDVLLVPMKRTETLSDTMPSKIFEIAAMERPIVIGAEGIAADLVTAHRAGLAVEPENVAALTAAIERLKAEPELGRAMQDGCRALARDYSRDKFAAAMLDEIKLAAKVKRANR
ncbi:MAG: glycosyltransferase family 4 protein [Alphaproteobacteria bacterium]|nr:glycosyltransferase family 4 protein [Alphaproteobacteria bacterium]